MNFDKPGDYVGGFDQNEAGIVLVVGGPTLPLTVCSPSHPLPPFPPVIGNCKHELLKLSSTNELPTKA